MMANKLKALEENELEALKKDGITILVSDIENWAVVESDRLIRAEHMIGCIESRYKPGNAWSWEHSDPTRAATTHRNAQKMPVQNEDIVECNRCWICGAKVPDGIVALVLMQNWEDL